MPKILLVEDDPLIYRMYQKLFELEGFETEVAENGEIGLDKLETFMPDIILLDIMMPTMNGLEMMSILKENPDTKDIPIAVLTNVADLGVANEVFKQGANLTIVKSETEPDQVIAWINSVLKKTGTQDTPTDDATDDDKPAPSDDKSDSDAPDDQPDTDE